MKKLAIPQAKTGRPRPRPFDPDSSRPGEKRDEKLFRVFIRITH
jgi:hypothetical protein